MFSSSCFTEVGDVNQSCGGGGEGTVGAWPERKEKNSVSGKKQAEKKKKKEKSGDGTVTGGWEVQRQANAGEDGALKCHLASFSA